MNVSSVLWKGAVGKRELGRYYGGGEDLGPHAESPRGRRLLAVFRQPWPCENFVITISDLCAADEVWGK